MEPYQPILLKDLRIELPSLTISQLAMNRHMPKVEEIAEHCHAYDQFLLYLRGSGIQRIGNQTIPVRRGSLIFLPSKEKHGFQKIDQQKPICLAIDLAFKSKPQWPTAAEIPWNNLTAIEHCLSRLSEKKTRTEFSTAAEILTILGIFESSRSSKKKKKTGPTTQAIRHWIRANGLDETITPASLAAAHHTSVDQLNRHLKRESSLTLGALLSAERFEKADLLLRKTDRPIGEIAEQTGFLDQNYFSRWFKKQAGQSPTEWRKYR